jgi:hypothetical protein
MKITYLIMIFAGFMLSHLNAGVVKESKTSVNFSGFGRYITETTTKIQGMRKLEDSEKEFKGEGFMGSLTAKFILKPGHDANLMALDEMKLYTIDHAKEEYLVRPIEKFKYDKQEMQGTEESDQEGTETENEEKNIRVVRNEFKVNATGEKKSINNFPCEKYVANWIFEWENTETGERGIDSLVSVVWTTKPTSEMQKAQQEEIDFNKQYLGKIGFETDDLYDEILGMRWMKMFSQINQSNSGLADETAPDFANEIRKIEGYPVVTDGSFYLIIPNQGEGQDETAREEQTEEKPRNLKGLFGGLMKKAMKPETEPEQEKKGTDAAFSFYNELIKLESKDINNNELTIPAGYTEVSGTD